MKIRINLEKPKTYALNKFYQDRGTNLDMAVNNFLERLYEEIPEEYKRPLVLKVEK